MWFIASFFKSFLTRVADELTERGYGDSRVVNIIREATGTTDEPAADEPVIESPVEETLVEVAEEPVADAPSQVEPSLGEPSLGEPSLGEPGADEPVIASASASANAFNSEETDFAFDSASGGTLGTDAPDAPEVDLVPEPELDPILTVSLPGEEVNTLVPDLPGEAVDQGFYFAV